MSLHTELAEGIGQEFAARLTAPPRLTQDALMLDLDNGVTLTVRYAAADAYSLRWRSAADTTGAEAGIDTAPTHPGLTTFPNHLHLADGRVVADPLTRPDATPAANLAAVIEALLRDPQLPGLQA